MTGMVKTVVADRGFAFIRPDDGSEDIFLHVRAVQGVDETFSLDSIRYKRVSYSLTVDPVSGRMRAADVVILEPAA